MIYTQGMSEEQYKQEVYARLFLQDRKALKYIPNYGRSNIDFVIADAKDEDRHLLWAEAKKDKTNPMAMLTQLLLTVRSTYFAGKVIPPAYLAVFDNEELHLYNAEDYTELFFRNDIEWKTRPSDHNNPRFKDFQKLVEKRGGSKQVIEFKDASQIREFKRFIGEDFLKQVEVQGIEITLANLNYVFNEWVDKVKPQIDATDAKWKEWTQKGIYAADFFLADAYVGKDKGTTLKDKLKVITYGVVYLINQGELFEKVNFKDGGRAYQEFWKRYKRPPRSTKAYPTEQTPWEQILERRDVLVPRDIMERKGAFFTPRAWVTKAHEYLAEVLGEDWQDEYVVYDCCAGSGNLLSGLSNRKNVYASDIDDQNVRIMTEETNPTYAENIFKFDFLNDPFVRKSKGGKVPDGLMDVLENREKRKKLVFLINPPYAEANNARKSEDGGKRGVNVSKVRDTYADILGNASRELYAQFITRIYKEFRGCILAEFSTTKIITGAHFSVMREWFKPANLGGFLVPADTFDNVKGQFVIGFKVWDTSKTMETLKYQADVYDRDEAFIGKKLVVDSQSKRISDWIREFPKLESNLIGSLLYIGNDFQQQNLVQIAEAGFKYPANAPINIGLNNLNAVAVYFAARWAEDSNWLNKSDQIMYPSKDPLTDTDFVNNCLLFASFYGHNHVTLDKGENHWIPFSEKELGVTTAPFAHSTLNKVFVARGITLGSKVLSAEAQEVLKAGYEVYKYYHTGNHGRPFTQSPDGTGGVYRHNAALYDIRRFFQGVKDNGHMKIKSKDEHYNKLIETLREKLRVLRDKHITPKVYEYGFLVAPEED